MYRLIGFHHTSNDLFLEYLKNNQKAIENLFTNVVYEFHDENSELLNRYSLYPDRFPSHILLYLGAKKSEIYGLIDEDTFISWLSDNTY